MTADKSRFRGILSTEGMEFRLGGIQLAMTDKGPRSIGDLEVRVRQDLCRHWLRLAFKHLEAASEANTELVAAAAADEGQAITFALEREFQASMQSIVACAVAFDALYAAVKARIEVPLAQSRAWEKNRTARWKRMAEVLRLGFALSNEATRDLRTSLREIMKFRGWAVHPPAARTSPILHTTIRCAVEWRFIAFDYANATAAVRATLSLVDWLAHHPRPRSQELAKYCSSLAAVTDQLRQAWAEKFPGIPLS